MFVEVLARHNEGPIADTVKKPARILRLHIPKSAPQELAFAVVLWYYDEEEATSIMSHQSARWPANTQHVISDHADIVDCRTIAGLADENFKQNLNYTIWLSTVDRMLVDETVCLKRRSA